MLKNDRRRLEFYERRVFGEFRQAVLDDTGRPDLNNQIKQLIEELEKYTTELPNSALIAIEKKLLK